MTISTNDIQALYIAYFNRPADTLGLKFWTDAANNAGSIQAIAGAFSSSAEYTETYAGMSTAERINTIYQNLFGRDAEPDGIVFWGNALDTGYLNIGNIAYQIFQGAQNADKVAVESKVTAAAAFTTSLDTSAEIVGYSGKAANGVASDWLKTIVNKATLDAATTADALLAVSTAATAAHDGQNNTGTTFSATVAIDTILGTNGNDIVNVFASGTKADGTNGSTLSANDSIDGGAGIDTLNLEVLSGLNASQVGTIKNVEIINISGADLISTDVAGTPTLGLINATKYQGSTNINILSATDAVTVTGLAGKTLGVGAGYEAATITADFNAAAATVALTDVATGLTVDIFNAKSTTLSLSGTVADDDGDAGTVTVTNTGAKVATLNLNLKSDAVVSVSTLAGLTSIVSTGAASVDVSDAGTSVQSVTTGAGDDAVSISFATSAASGSVAAKNATVSTGAGDDVITVATTGNGLTTVDAGAGDDDITVTKAAGALSISGGAGDDTVTLLGDALAITDVIDGGAGNDTIALAGTTAARSDDDFIVLTKLIKNFESLEFTSAEGFVAGAVGGAGEVALEASKLTSYSSFTFDAGDSFIKGVAAAQSVVVGRAATSVTATAAGYTPQPATGGAATVYGGTLNISDSVDTTASTVVARADTVNLTVKAINTRTDAALASTDVTLTGDVKTAVVTINNGVAAVDGVTLHDNQANVVITTGTTNNSLAGNTAESQLGNLTTLTLSGSGSAKVTNVEGTKLVTVDATALGGTYTVTADGHTKGGATVGLVYSTTNTAVETIKLGAGIDDVTFSAASSTYGALGSYKADTVTGLKLVLNADKTALAASSDKLHIATTGDIFKETTTQTDLDLALKGFAAAHVSGTVVFAFGGDTYVYSDTVGAGTVDSADILVKLTGAIDLDALKLALTVV
jgi:hypothetical protein